MSFDEMPERPDLRLFNVANARMAQPEAYPTAVDTTLLVEGVYAQIGVTLAREAPVERIWTVVTDPADETGFLTGAVHTPPLGLPLNGGSQVRFAIEHVFQVAQQSE